MGKNADTVMGMYAAFGRGDVDHILAQMRDDISWDDGVRETDLPYLSSGTGKDHVISFFTSLAENVEFSVFEPGTPCEGGDTVMVAVREAGRNIKTNAPIAEDLAVHLWRFDDDGKVASFRHIADWATHETAAKAHVTA